MTVKTAGREIIAKIVYYGPAAGGKTTNLQFIHAHLPEGTTGKLVSTATRTDRTLFFDFLSADLGEIDGRRVRFLLYTVPGQVYYNATRKLVLSDADAIVFVADSSAACMEQNVASMSNLEENLEECGMSLRSIPWVIQYNKRDVEDAVSVIDLHKRLNPIGVPAFEATATAGVGVYETLQGITLRLHSLLESKVFGDEEGGGVAPDDLAGTVDDALREVSAADDDGNGLGFDIEHEPTSDTVKLQPSPDEADGEGESDFITDPMRPRRAASKQPQAKTETKSDWMSELSSAGSAPPPKARAAAPKAPAPSAPKKTAAPPPGPSAAPTKSAAPVATAPAPTATTPPSATGAVEIRVPVTLTRAQIRKSVPVKLILDVKIEED